jgi:hypothetical protein
METGLFKMTFMKFASNTLAKLSMQNHASEQTPAIRITLSHLSRLQQTRIEENATLNSLVNQKNLDNDIVKVRNM